MPTPSPPMPLMPPSSTNSTIGRPQPHLTISHHKVSPGAAALGSAAFQQMDEWAPYRMALLLLLVASSIALWASYKILCESDERDEVIYQPLAAPLQMAQMEDEEFCWGIEEGNQGVQCTIKSVESASSSSLSSSVEECLLNGTGGLQRQLPSKIRSK